MKDIDGRLGRRKGRNDMQRQTLATAARRWSGWVGVAVRPHGPAWAGRAACVGLAACAALVGCGQDDVPVEGPSETSTGDDVSAADLTTLDSTAGVDTAKLADVALATDSAGQEASGDTSGAKDTSSSDAGPADSDSGAPPFDSGYAPDGAQLCSTATDCPDPPNDCRVFVCTKSKVCVLIDAEEGAACDDADPCTLLGKCSVGQCYKGQKLQCDDGKACTSDGCDPKAGCVYTANSEPCSDGDVCTVNDACAQGACKAGAAKDCSDANPCTLESCDSKSGCSQAPVGGTCEDGSACTQGDTCAFGACQGGKPLACGDGNGCTTDACLPAKGCVLTPNSLACSDGSVCTEGDACAAGACVSGTAKPCDDSEPCTSDSCNAIAGCVQLPSAVTCTDGNACTTGDDCKDGTCAPKAAAACDDGNPCTTDSCLPKSGCTAAPNEQPCSDGDACTSTDTCAAGTCKGGLPPGCSDSNPCTDDSCEPKSGCTWTNNAESCSDGNACSLNDGCKGGTCTPGKAPECEDTNPCTSATCDPGAGCKNVPNALPCTDNNACTVGDACAATACSPGKALACDDLNPCTNDACDAKTGCGSQPNQLACSDGNACTQKDKCDAGACKSGSAVTCDDGNPCTTDACEPAKGCTKTPHTALCDDGSVCTAGDKCAGGVCVAGGAIGCVDGNPCTEDACNPKTGCVFLPSQAKCSDGNACTDKDVCGSGGCAGAPITCDDKNPCTIDYCDAFKACQTVPNAASCSDGSECTTGDTCQAGACKGVAIPCDDGNPCTQDGCNALTGCIAPAVSDGSPCGASGGVCKGGQCSLGGPTNPALHCAQILQAVAGSADGAYWLDPDGSGPGQAYATWCDMTRDGGGWTLVATVADDGKNTWTWNNRLYWSTDKTPFGSAADSAKDFKSPAYHDVSFTDVMFSHAPSNLWAAYGKVGNGKTPFATLVAVTSGPVCWQPSQGWKQAAGTLVASGKLCSTNLYLNCADHDGTNVCGDDEYSWGPCWSAATNSTCPFDDPGQSSALGACFNQPNTEVAALGWGLSLGNNTGTPGTGQNRMTMWVR